MSQIVRGNDELAFYLKGVGKEYYKDILVAVSIKDGFCPMCNKSVSQQYYPDFSIIYEHIHTCSQKWDMNIFNKAYAMLQQLIKYEVNDNSRIRVRKYKKAEVIYTLNKVHGLPIHLIAKMLNIGLSRAMDLSYTGMVLCNNDMPNWVKNVLEHKK